MTERETSVPGSRRRRRLALTAGMISLALIVTACGGGGSDTGGDGGPVTLRFAWWGSDTRHEYTQRIIDLYESENPSVTIEPTFSGFADYWDRLATAVAGRGAPDVMQQETRYVREYADRGALLDLSEYVPEIIRTEHLDPAVMQAGVIGESMYAIPIGINAHAVLADPQVFSEAGIPVPDDATWTYADLVQTAAAVTSATPAGTWGFQATTAIDTSFEIFARQRGEQLFNEAGDLGFRRESLVEWWRYQQELHDTGGAPPASETVELEAADIDGSLFSTHQGAMGTAWTNQLLANNEAAGRELQLLRFPGEGTQAHGGMYFKPSQFWSASADTQHPRETARFIDFLLNDPRVADLMLSERGLPVNTELRQQILGQLAPADQQAAAFLAKIEPHIGAPPPLPPKGAGEVQGIMQQLNEQVLFGQLTVEEAADAFMAQVDAATS
jgi:multiple sugar transport system substrate-binding protein